MSGVDGSQSPGGLREQIADAIREHSLFEHDWGVDGDCTCGHAAPKEWDDFASYTAHVADAVVAALGLEEEWNVLTDMGVKSHSPLTEERARHLAERFNDMTARRRWVSGWSVVAVDK